MTQPQPTGLSNPGPAPPAPAERTAPRSPGAQAWLGDCLDAMRLLQAGGSSLAQMADLLGLSGTAAGLGGRLADDAAATAHAAERANRRGLGDREPTGPVPADVTPPAQQAPADAAAPAADTASAANRNDHRLPSRLQPVPADHRADNRAGNTAANRAGADHLAPAPAGWASLAPLRSEPLVARPPVPLLPPQRQRALLSALLATTVPEGGLDLASLIADAAAGRTVSRLPRLPRRTLRRGAELRIDVADWLRPFAADQSALARYLARLLPPGRLRVARIQAGPQPLPAPRGRQAAGAGAAQAPLRGAPVLLLSDLGAGAGLLGPTPAAPAAWRQWARQLAQRGQRALVLSPRPDSALARACALPVWHWHEGLRVQAVWHQRSHASGPPAPVLAADLAALAAVDGTVHQRQASQWRQLLQLLSPALRITPWLLRAARRTVQPPLPPAAEAEFWFSPLIALRGHDALVLDPDLRTAVLASLDEDPDTAGQALALLHASWQGRRDLSVLEEQLCAAELQARLAQPGGRPDEATLATLLGPALKTLAVAPGPRGAGRQARELAGWAVHAWQRLSPTLQASDALRQLAYAAARHLGSGQVLADRQGRLPPMPAPAPWLLPPDDAPQVALAVELRRYADGSTNLVIGPARPPTSALHRITLPLLGPLWLEVAGGVVAEGAEAPSQVLAIDPTRFTQVEVAASHAAQPLTLQALGGASWQLWQAGTLAEAIRPAWLGHEAGLGLLMLDASRALVWPGEVFRRDPDRVLQGIGELAFSPGVGLDADRPSSPATEQAVPSTRVRLLGPLPYQRGLVAVQVLDPPAGCVPLDQEARLPGETGLAAAGESAGYADEFADDYAGNQDRSDAARPSDQQHRYLGLAQPGQRPQQGWLHYHGEGSYDWLPGRQAPGLLLPGYGHYGPMLVAAPEAEPQPRDIVVPLLLDALRREARDVAPPLWKALIMALPGAEKQAFSLWDHLINSIGLERVTHDHDGRFLPHPLAREQVLRGCDLVVLVGHAPPAADDRAALETALELGKTLAWLPLVDGPADRPADMPVDRPDAGAAARLQDWPAALRQALQSAPPLATTDRMDQAARQVIALMDGPARRGGASSVMPASVAAPPPMPAPVSDLGLVSSLRSSLLRKLDKRSDAEIGLFRLQVRPGGGLVGFEPAKWPVGEQPALLLIHGELADTEPSFGALWQADNADWARLRAQYGERIYAWRWRTVSPGIGANMRLLQDKAGLVGAPVHLLTLGAGGLLPELMLALEQASGEDCQRLSHQVWPGLDEPWLGPVHDDRQAVAGFSALRFYTGKPRIERFVRVACPAAGTPVFGRGFDRWLKLLRRVPGVSLLGPLLPDTVLDDPQAAPGLAGLLPGAGVLPLLTTTMVTDTPLAIVAAVEGVDSTANWFRSLATRALGMGGVDSDGVVPLASAIGGIERRGGVDYRLLQGAGVGHFNYLQDPVSRAAIVDALLSPPGQVPGFAHADSLAALQAGQGRATAGPRSQA